LLTSSLTESAEKWYYAFLQRRRAQVPGAAAAGGAQGAGLPAAHGNNAVNPPPLTFNELTAALRRAFATYDDKGLIEERIRNRVQREHEAAEDYAFGLVDLLMEYNPDMEESEQTRYLVRNCRPAILREIATHNPVTIEHFLVLARKADYATRILNNRPDVNAIQFNERANTASSELATARNTRLDDIETGFADMKAQFTTLLVSMPPAQPQPGLLPLPQQGGVQDFQGQKFNQGPQNRNQQNQGNQGFRGRQNNRGFINRNGNRNGFGNRNGNANRNGFNGQFRSGNPQRRSFFCVVHQWCNHPTETCRAMRAQQYSQPQYQQGPQFPGNQTTWRPDVYRPMPSQPQMQLQPQMQPQVPSQQQPMIPPQPMPQ
jgi:hypothetical protein